MFHFQCLVIGAVDSVARFRPITTANERDANTIRSKTLSYPDDHRCFPRPSGGYVSDGNHGDAGLSNDLVVVLFRCEIEFSVAKINSGSVDRRKATQNDSRQGSDDSSAVTTDDFEKLSTIEHGISMPVGGSLDQAAGRET